MSAAASAETCKNSPRFASKKDGRGQQLALPDGSSAEIRLIRPEDHEALVAFHRMLSDKTVYSRYFSPISLAHRIDETHIAQELCNDPDHHMTLIVERTDPISRGNSIVGVGRLVLLDHSAAEFAITIRDDFQGMGLGMALLNALVDRGRAEHLAKITACILYDNAKMLQLCRERGFHVVSHDSGGPLEVALELA